MTLNRTDPERPSILQRRFTDGEDSLALLVDKWKAAGVGAGWEFIKAGSGFVHPALTGALEMLEKGYGAVKDHSVFSGVQSALLQDLAGLGDKEL